MHPESVRRALLAVILILLVMVLLQCGPGSDSQPAPPASTEPEAPADDEFQGYMDALALPDLPAEIHAWVLEQLAPSDDPRALQALVDGLDSSDPIVIMTAVEAVWQRDDPRVRPALERLRDHPDPAVSSLVRERLQGLD